MKRKDIEPIEHRPIYKPIETRPVRKPEPKVPENAFDTLGALLRDAEATRIWQITRQTAEGTNMSSSEYVAPAEPQSVDMTGWDAA